ncbi:hypothetical protein D3C72_2213970 [compost metagenome]
MTNMISYQGLVRTFPKSYKKEVGRWDYNFEIKGQYEITPKLQANGRYLIVHHVQ